MSHKLYESNAERQRIYRENKARRQVEEDHARRRKAQEDAENLHANYEWTIGRLATAVQDILQAGKDPEAHKHQRRQAADIEALLMILESTYLFGEYQCLEAWSILAASTRRSYKVLESVTERAE